MQFSTCPIYGRTFSYTTRTTLLKDVQSGDEYAWNKFYSRYAGMIRKIGKIRNLSSEECDDLMIDVMVIFWKKIENFTYDPEKGKFRTFLAKIAHCAAIKIFNRRDESGADGISAEVAEEYPGGIDRKYMQEWQDFVLNCAMEELKRQIDTDSYQVFYMLFIQKRPVNEITAITRKSRNNIYVIRSRCMKKLKALISRYRSCNEALLLSHSHNMNFEN